MTHDQLLWENIDRDVTIERLGRVTYGFQTARLWVSTEVLYVLPAPFVNIHRGAVCTYSSACEYPPRFCLPLQLRLWISTEVLFAPTAPLVNIHRGSVCPYSSVCLLRGYSGTTSIRNQVRTEQLSLIALGNETLCRRKHLSPFLRWLLQQLEVDTYFENSALRHKAVTAQIRTV